MDAKKIKTILHNEKGQAIFEFIVFVPFYVYLLTVLISFGNSLNASINQNKVLRGYFYRVAAGDSRLPIREDLEKLGARGLSTVGMSVIGYREKEASGDQSYAGCVKVLKYVGASNSNESCEEIDAGSGQTHFIRIYTAYGVCGESWVSDGKGYFGRDYARVSGNSCVVNE